MLVLQNDRGNCYSPTVIVAALTSQTQKARLPTHIRIHGKRCGLDRDSVVLLEQIRTIDKVRLGSRIGVLPPADLARVEEALRISLGVS